MTPGTVTHQQIKLPTEKALLSLQVHQARESTYHC
jgi:hypothetical protein